jgi:hypothetical protein
MSGNKDANAVEKEDAPLHKRSYVCSYRSPTMYMKIAKSNTGAKAAARKTRLSIQFAP